MRVPARLPLLSRGTLLFVALALAAVSTIALALERPRSATVADYLAHSSIAGRDLRVGVLLPERPPPGGPDPYATGRGFDVDLALAFARSLGVTAHFRVLDSTDRVAALVERKVDVVFAGLLRTAEREQAIQFAGPYREGGLVVATRTTWPSPAKRQRLCVVAGSVVEPVAARAGVVLVRRPTTNACLTDVLAGRLDAVAGEEIVLRGHAHASEGKLKLFPLAANQQAQRYFIGVVPGDPFLKALVNSFLQASYAREVDGAWQQAAARHLAPRGFTGRQPRPEGTLLRGAGDGPRSPDGAAGVPPAVTTVAPPTRHGFRTVAHRRHRHATRRTVRLTTGRAPGGTAPDGPPVPPGGPVLAGVTRNGPPSPGAWSLLFGVPVTVSALYLWIQSGGDRQFTLMLAQSVNPINFLATVSLSVVWIFPAVPALLFTVGAVVLSSVVDQADRQRLCDAYTVARWTARTPGWMVWTAMVTAAVSTPLVFAPAWALALCVARQPAVTGRRSTMARRLRWPALLALGMVTGLLAYRGIVRGEPTLALTVAWPVLLLLAGVDAPLRPAHVPAFLRASAALAGLLALGVVHAVVTTPILPSTSLQIASPPPSSTPGPDRTPAGTDPDAPADPPLRHLRGYVVSVDDGYTTVLSDAGGIEVVGNDEIRSRVSCPSLTDLPEDSPALVGLPLRESLLQALARQQRPTTLEDPRCIVRVDAPSR
ncbi:substrate-binding periplasmic protein [Micromonospora sp. H33]|uniref:substrate-binding periplasmic protein n=1 Tax=Micromonospora sp. H33 TaxID=3452215 RepID=UPI003F8BB23B